MVGVTRARVHTLMVHKFGRRVPSWVRMSSAQCSVTSLELL